ncbi:MAG: calcium/sodium antiporter [Lachnospiraceae bacterium]
MMMLLQVLLLAVGFLMLVKGADWFVDGSSGVAEKFGIPQLVIGLTIVAMGTSAPEAAVSITAALKESADITVGNVVGSNILNILIILGLASAITPIRVAKTTIRYELPFMFLVTFLLLGLGCTDGKIEFREGLVFIFVFLLYLAYMFRMAKTKQEETEENHTGNSVVKLILMAAVGLVLIVWGSDVTVDAATYLAEMFGVSERFIGLTIVALGTSLPELFTSVAAARKGKADIAIGNIVGSNIFNILFVVGISSLIVPVPFASGFVIDCLAAAGSGVILWMLAFKDQRLDRKGGILMLICYAVYFIWLCQ